MESNALITFVAEALFAMIFVVAFLGYLRTRDPLQRDVMLVFLAITALFVIQLYTWLIGPAPAVASSAALILLLFQPYFTLRLAGRLRPVPRWLTAAALAALGSCAILVVAVPRPRPAWAIAVMFGTFVVAELVAAGYLIAEGRRRVGPSGVRLTIAGWSTATLATALLGLVFGTLARTRAWALDVWTASLVVALLSALGYVVAFLPPRWLRRVWAASAWDTVNHHLLNAPTTATPEEIWCRYAEMVRRTVAADAVAVVVRRPDGSLDQPAFDGVPADAPGGTPAELDALLAARQPVRLTASAAPAPELRAHYAGRVDSDLVTALPLTVPPGGAGALLIFNRHRSLFGDDDLRLLAQVGGQTGVLAERGAVIAEQRRLADQLAASVEALSRASQAKSDFLASMSHELRTPLNAIIGFSDLMRSEQPAGDQRTVPADWVDHIHASGRHLLGLINDVLDLTKVEAGRLDLQPVPLRVDNAAAELVTSLRPLIDGKRLTVGFDIPPLTANADPIRFRQMLENLLSNAIKFTPAGGRITVSGTKTDGNVTVSVEDTGVGIAPEDAQRVFEEFQQVGDPAARQAGTGLGLALTRRLAQAHGGDILLRSEPGRGSRFTICLPAAAPPPADTAGAGPGELPPGTARVLLVEDDQRATELLRTHLAGAGYDVRTASSGEAGLAAARRDRPDAVLLDVVLPGMQGWEVLREFKNDPALGDIPVFLVTVVDERRAGAALGATEYFVKPVDQAQLLAALARHVLPPRDGGEAAVLVVEPDDEARGRLERHLRDSGADVVSCTDGGSGLAASRQRRFDLIVCDATVPDVDGLALLSALKDDPVTRHTPVLTVSSDTVDAEGHPAIVGQVFGTAAHGSPAWRSLLSLTGGEPSTHGAPPSADGASGDPASGLQPSGADPSGVAGPGRTR